MKSIERFSSNPSGNLKKVVLNKILLKIHFYFSGIFVAVNAENFEFQKVAFGVHSRHYKITENEKLLYLIF